MRSADASGESQGFPDWTLAVVLFALVPFAVLMAAIMIAVCAFARTFKEAQNYIMPVIMLVLVPGGKQDPTLLAGVDARGRRGGIRVSPLGLDAGTMVGRDANLGHGIAGVGPTDVPRLARAGDFPFG